MHAITEEDVSVGLTCSDAERQECDDGDVFADLVNTHVESDSDDRQDETDETDRNEGLSRREPRLIR